MQPHGQGHAQGHGFLHALSDQAGGRWQGGLLDLKEELVVNLQREQGKVSAAIRVLPMPASKQHSTPTGVPKHIHHCEDQSIPDGLVKASVLHGCPGGR